MHTAQSINDDDAVATLEFKSLTDRTNEAGSFSTELTAEATDWNIGADIPGSPCAAEIFHALEGGQTLDHGARVSWTDPSANQLKGLHVPIWGGHFSVDHLGRSK